MEKRGIRTFFTGEIEPIAADTLGLWCTDSLVGLPSLPLPFLDVANGLISMKLRLFFLCWAADFLFFVLSVDSEPYAYFLPVFETLAIV